MFQRSNRRFTTNVLNRHELGFAFEAKSDFHDLVCDGRDIHNSKWNSRNNNQHCCAALRAKRLMSMKKIKSCMQEMDAPDQL
jgi:hypothetical protein